ncbi:hypothetical protein BJV78DRAFT_1311117 [Lactifluus subvellereus]|nr:hypothetical protein BJV78DRAFT_1311117 [Lactifluus subvellereus]
MSSRAPASGEAHIQLSRDDRVLIKRWWKDCYEEIDNHGYRLDDQYIPSPNPSRIRASRTFNSILSTGLVISVCARRKIDGLRVVLTWVPPMFSPPRLPEEDPRNHCVPLLCTIEVQNRGSHLLMVTPFLHPFDKLRFKTFADFVSFFAEICEGLQFMHEHNVAHRDCTAKRIMMIKSSEIPSDYGAQRPRRYYFIDLGLSRQYSTRDTADEPPSGSMNLAPECRTGTRCNPFRTDIYYIGKLVREKFIDVRRFHGFDSMGGLVGEMTQQEPENRPHIEDVVSKFVHVRPHLGTAKLRRRVGSSWWRYCDRRRRTPPALPN